MEVNKIHADARLIWICLKPEQDFREQRILNLLADPQPVVLKSDSDVIAFEFEPSDLVVLNSAAQHERAATLIEHIGQKVPGIRILVRCCLDERPLDLIRRFESIGLLDSDEGPELTRARLMRAFADGRIAAGRNACSRDAAGLVMNRQVPKDRGDRVPEWRKNLIGRSAAVQKIAETIRLVGPRRCTVLITGETGTGKEVVARAIHLAGPRSAKQFVALNCSAIPVALLEAELFGHTRGAFTGAAQARIGRFEQAQGGTLFLDEIGDLPLELQAKLLRVLQEREFQRLGSSETIRADVRIIAATNSSLQAKMQEGLFREDLFYRLNVVPLGIPPLRMRISDIRPLAEHFLAKICKEEDLVEKQITPQSWAALEQYDWPGNVRELENAISSAAILSEDEPYLRKEDFAVLFPHAMHIDQDQPGVIQMPLHGLDFTKTIMDFERNLVSQALTKTGGNKKAAAEMLKLKRTTLSAKIRVLELARVVA